MIDSCRTAIERKNLLIYSETYLAAYWLQNITYLILCSFAKKCKPNMRPEQKVLISRLKAKTIISR